MLFTWAEASGDANKVTASPPQGGGLRTQSRFSPRLRPQMTRIELPLHHLGRCLTSSILLFTQVEASGDANRVGASPARGGGVACALNLTL